jgi:hypothetical protein
MTDVYISYLVYDAPILGMCPLLGPTLTQTGGHYNLLFALRERGRHLQKLTPCHQSENLNFLRCICPVLTSGKRQSAAPIHHVNINIAICERYPTSTLSMRVISLKQGLACTVLIPLPHLNRCGIYLCPDRACMYLNNRSNFPHQTKKLSL